MIGIPVDLVLEISNYLTLQEFRNLSKILKINDKLYSGLYNPKIKECLYQLLKSGKEENVVYILKRNKRTVVLRKEYLMFSIQDKLYILFEFLVKTDLYCDKNHSINYSLLDEKMYRILISCGFNVNQRSANGSTLLHYAQNLQVVDFLVSMGATVDCPDDEGQTVRILYHSL